MKGGKVQIDLLKLQAEVIERERAHALYVFEYSQKQKELETELKKLREAN